MTKRKTSFSLQIVCNISWSKRLFLGLCFMRRTMNMPKVSCQQFDDTARLICLIHITMHYIAVIIILLLKQFFSNCCNFVPLIIIIHRFSSIYVKVRQLNLNSNSNTPRRSKLQENRNQKMEKMEKPTSFCWAIFTKLPKCHANSYKNSKSTTTTTSAITFLQASFVCKSLHQNWMTKTPLLGNVHNTNCPKFT